MSDRFKFRTWDNRFKKYRNGLAVYNNTICTYDDNDCILEQCTGLKDKNGKLIYEGDILDFYLSNPKNGGHYKGIVVWYPLNSLIGWMIEDLGRNGAWDIRDTAHPNDWMIWGEVIGNIHENADLLENKDE